MSRPASSMRPALCTSSPAMMRSSVVLPQPEGPRKQTNSPLAMSRSMPDSALNAPNSLRMPASRRYGAALTEGGSLLFALAAVALVPLTEDALAVLGGPREIHLHQARFVVLGHVGQRCGDAGLCGDCEILAIEQHGVLARRPVGE